MELERNALEKLDNIVFFETENDKVYVVPLKAYKKSYFMKKKAFYKDLCHFYFKNLSQNEIYRERPYFVKDAWLYVKQKGKIAPIFIGKPQMEIEFYAYLAALVIPKVDFPIKEVHIRRDGNNKFSSKYYVLVKGEKYGSVAYVTNPASSRKIEIYSYRKGLLKNDLVVCKDGSFSVLSGDKGIFKSEVIVLDDILSTD